MMKIPFATQYKNKMRERGDYVGGKGPLGLLIHTTDGRFENGIKDAYRAIDGGIENNFTFLCCSQDGSLVQAHDVMKWGAHAGKSEWLLKMGGKFVMRDFVHDELIGYEQNCAGMVFRVGDELFPWWAFVDGNPKNKLLLSATPIDSDDVRFISKDMEKEWGCPRGYYHKLSAAQENTLIRTIMWLYVNVEPFKLENVVAHHEVSGMRGLGYWRKTDCGGSLSMPMDVFRKYLIENKTSLIAKYGIKKEAA